MKTSDDRVTLSGREPEPETATGFREDTQEPVFEGGAPAGIDPRTGQHRDYWVLSAEERARGFVRPVRDSYVHVGRRPKNPILDLTPEQRALVGTDSGFVKFEPEGGRSGNGRFWTLAELSLGCGTKTTMGQKLAETYAARPTFYGATFCCGCGAHFPVGADGEFVWDKTDERVGT